MYTLRTMTTDGILDTNSEHSEREAWEEWDLIELQLARGYIAQLIAPNGDVLAEAIRQ